MRDEAEINSEIKRLKTVLRRLPHRASCVQAQIDVLEDRMTESGVYDMFRDEEYEDVGCDDEFFVYAMDAFRWLTSKSQKSLAKEWESLWDK